MNAVKIAVFIIVAIFLSLAAFAADGPVYEGTWIGTAELPGQVVDTVTLILKKTKTGFEGTVSDTLGVLALETPLTEVVLDGKDIRIDFPTVDGVMITLQMKPEGDKMTGQWSDAEGESGKVELARKK